MEKYKRTMNCGQARAADAGQTVTLNGWVHRLRDHGGIFFINLRDRYGITQIVAGEDSPAEARQIASALHNEYCIAVCGTVRERPASMVNKDMATGEVELAAQEIVILGCCDVLPFQIDEGASAREELRLKYRYLDLRSAAMQKRILLRSEVLFAVREFMKGEDFLEIETPTLIKSTPEGARDYLVPSRLYPGSFYALPQSPQLYKQLLMVSGFDKYYQIARCYRDEDSRGDRQPEFTQIDIEMSFVEREDVLSLTERMMGAVFQKVLGIGLPAKFRRLTYREAMERYGTDKPDLRFDMPLHDFGVFVRDSGFRALTEALEKGEAEKQAALANGHTKDGGAVKALVVPGKADYSRKQIEELEEHAKIYKAKGLAWLKVAADGNAAPGSAAIDGSGAADSGLRFEGGAAKFFAPQAAAICEALGAKAGDLILIAGDADRRIANTSLGAVRSKLGKDLGLYGGTPRFEFVWIVDFPLFEFNAEANHWEAAHHLFSYPQEKFHDTLEKDPGAVLGDLYDLVLNGYELASGSIRIHDPVLQKRIFAIAGFSEEEAEKRFGFLTGAFKYGAPPHGGIAPGLDRLVMLMAGEASIKEVIAFPKNSFAQSPMDDSPAPAGAHQLAELSLAVINRKT
ncbi:MAG: aspartate--tRNA ligase [Spirochaetaceae bacterium]|jgi:aspartyl-tRNA synthetase|nr:aspartate--tRNA ligase [Spirochaetaceae bacterium]